MERGCGLAQESIFHFLVCGSPGLFKCCSPVSITVCIMDNHHTGQEETLMEVKLGMNGVALSRLSRTQPRRSSSFKCVLVSATLLTLAISLVVAIMVALFILLPQCNLVRKVSLQPCCVLSPNGVCVCVCLFALIIIVSACRISPHLLAQQKSAKSISYQVSAISFLIISGAYLAHILTFYLFIVFRHRNQYPGNIRHLHCK